MFYVTKKKSMFSSVVTPAFTN